MLELDEGKRYRNWVFTYNNPEPTWDSRVCFDASGARFFAGQYERGVRTGTPHFQGYVVFHHPVGLAGAKRKLQLPGIHLEVRRGTHQEALDYVEKEETRVPDTLSVQYGEVPPGQGIRTDVFGCKAIIDRGGSLLDVAEEQFGAFCRYYRAFERYAGLRSNPRDTPPRVYYHWGPAGSGKTRAVWAAVEDVTRVYPAPLDPTGRAVWFDGYRPDHHRVILLDDYYHNYRLSFFLQLLDRYPMYLPIKGGFTHASNCDIYLTSNIPLEAQYPNAPDQNAIRRRFTSVIHFDGVNNLGQ